VPVYAVEAADAKRLFVLNRGSGHLTVINTQDDTLDSCTPSPTSWPDGDLPPHPAAFAYSRQYHQRCVHGIRFNASAMRWPAKRHQRHGVNRGPGLCRIQMPQPVNWMIANYDGGTISIIDVSLDEWGNDSSTFGTTFTVTVGKNPASVTVLYDEAEPNRQSDPTRP